MPNDNCQFGRRRPVAFPVTRDSSCSASLQLSVSLSPSLTLTLSLPICVFDLYVPERASVITPSPYLPSHCPDGLTVCPSTQWVSD